jgi:hypothetical protein
MDSINIVSGYAEFVENKEGVLSGSVEFVERRSDKLDGGPRKDSNDVIPQPQTFKIKKAEYTT